MRVVHCKKEPYDVYIGRPGPYGNWYTHLGTDTSAKVRVATREEAISRYEADLREMIVVDPKFMDEYLKPIAGKTLGCWCAPKPCHGDVLIKLCRELGLIT